MFANSYLWIAQQHVWKGEWHEGQMALFAPHGKQGLHSFCLVDFGFWARPGSGLTCFRAYPRIFTQGSLLAMLGDHMVYQGLNPGGLCGRQVGYPLYYFSNPNVSILELEITLNLVSVLNYRLIESRQRRQEHVSEPWKQPEVVLADFCGHRLISWRFQWSAYSRGSQHHGWNPFLKHHLRHQSDTAIIHSSPFERETGCHWFVSVILNSVIFQSGQKERKKRNELSWRARSDWAALKSTPSVGIECIILLGASLISLPGLSCHCSGMSFGWPCPYICPPRRNITGLTFTYTCARDGLWAFRARSPKSPPSPGEGCPASPRLWVGAVDLREGSVLPLGLMAASQRGEPGRVRTTVLGTGARQPLQSSARLPVP